MPDLRALTAPQLVAKWKSIVNDNVMMGRDAHLLKEFLIRATPLQILEGFYQYRGQRTVTIPQFLRQHEKWLEEDEIISEIELARHISGTTPTYYYTYFENKDFETSEAIEHALEAWQLLKEWAMRIIG